VTDKLNIPHEMNN